jgi:general secretion pathway protein A
MYRNHFGFEELPFSITPDPRFIYNSANYEDVLGKLRYGIEAKKGFIVVSGEAGTGKTTLLRRLMRGFSDRIAYAYIFNPRLKFTSLLRAILKDLGIPARATDKESMLEQLNEYVLRQHKQGRIVTWIFDEAQGLSDEVLEELRLLGNLETDSEKLIQIILVGQPELESRLDRPKLRQFKQRVAYRLVLYPLAPHEVSPYLAARLDQAGYKGGELFNLTTVNLIAAYSRGIPRVINSLCDNALGRACQAGSTTITPEVIDDAAAELRLDERLRSEPKQSVETVDAPSELANCRAPAIVDTGGQADELISAVGYKTPPALESIARPVRADFAVDKQQLGFAIGALIAIVALAWGLAVSWPLRPEVTVSHTNDSAIVVRDVMPGLAVTPAPLKTSLDRSRPSWISVKIMPQAPVGVMRDSAPQTPERPGNAQHPPVANRKIIQPPALKEFRVSEATFLRNKPTANADIIDTLRPGIRVEVIGRGGEFLRVRSLGDDRVRGYVHVDDAFFEPLR